MAVDSENIPATATYCLFDLQVEVRSVACDWKRGESYVLPVGESTATPFSVVQNWDAGLKK